MEIDFYGSKLEVKLRFKPKPEFYIKSCKNNQWYPIDSFEYGVIANVLPTYEFPFPKVCYGYYDNDGFHANEGRPLTSKEKGFIKYKTIMDYAQMLALIILLILSVPVVILVSVLLHTWIIFKVICMVFLIVLGLLVFACI